MDDKIIAAAREAGITASIGQTINGKYKPNVNALGHSVPVEWLSRFYAIAYRQGLEDAAKLLETKKEWRGGKWVSTLSPETASAIAAAIRALKEKDHG